MEKESFPNYNVYCEFKMTNTPRKPFFYLETDFVGQQIIITPPPVHLMRSEIFKNWLFNHILKGYQINHTVKSEWFRMNKIIIRDARKDADAEKTFNLFSTILDCLLTKKKNYIFDLYTFRLKKS